MYSYHSCFNINIHFISQLPPPFTQYRRTHKESRWSMSITPPSIQLSHKMDRCFGCSIIQWLQSSWSVSTTEETRGEVLFGGIVILQKSKCAYITFGWKKENNCEWEIILFFQERCILLVTTYLLFSWKDTLRIRLSYIQKGHESWAFWIYKYVC